MSRPRKRFGQHFLHDRLVIERIVQAVAPAPSQRIVEIGPGLGAITLPLLQATGALEAIELDRDLLPELRQRCQDAGSLQVHQGDVLAVDFSALRATGQRLRIVGNLPYNISTPLIFRLLEASADIVDMHFMLQSEVVDRLAATAATPSYGRLSVMVQYRCEVLPLFGVEAAAFRPPPRVNSAFVRLTPHSVPPLTTRDQGRLSALVAMAFSQRRKTVRNSLKPLLSATEIEAAGVDPAARPETLHLAQFVALNDRWVERSPET